LGLVDYVQLQARRVMINESFRSTRVVNIPPQLALPTFTPSNTPPPSLTPRRTPRRARRGRDVRWHSRAEL
jgi:hypothetical protein